MNPKIVVTDYAFPDLSIEQAVLASCELTGRQCKTEADLLDLCKDADAVITQFARVNANVIAGMARAKAIRCRCPNEEDEMKTNLSVLKVAALSVLAGGPPVASSAAADAEAASTPIAAVVA